MDTGSTPGSAAPRVPAARRWCFGILLADAVRGWPRKGVANLRALLGGAHALSYGMPEAIARLVVGAVPEGGGM